MNMVLFSQLMTLVLFSAGGYFLSRCRAFTASKPMFIGLFFALVLFGFIGVDTRLFALDDFSINLNYAGQGFILGILLEITLRKLRENSQRENG